MPDDTTTLPGHPQTRQQDLIRQIRDLIIDGTLEPGERIPERILTERFGISRTPLREALRALAAEGVLDLLPNRGARVRKLGAEEIDELFQVMGALEGLSGELAAKRATDENIAEIKALHYQMLLHAARRELMEYFRLNQRIHEKILAIAGNATLSELYGMLANRIRRARYSANIAQTRWDQAVAEHEDILAALEARDGVLLSERLRRHLAKTCETVRAAVAAEEPATMQNHQKEETA
jgi:DNA-binding GntR family transcriptional regulator